CDLESNPCSCAIVVRRTQDSLRRAQFHRQELGEDRCLELPMTRIICLLLVLRSRAVRRMDNPVPKTAQPMKIPK
ncbi:MAG TPA: hypothetical protein VFO82_14200, partial [Steroidobacteraceae bacterium]|nr:hypothetical protein [Steroidobacteraceae bacterium]